jgi:FkbM family methyltransferase
MYQNFKWTVVAEDRIAILKQYEPLQPYLLIELAKIIEAEVFLDIGANIGAYSVLMSSLDSVEKIYAFEPSPKTYEELKANVALNDENNKITISSTALSDGEKSVPFGVVSDYSGANGIVGSSIHNEKKFAEQITVESKTLDSIVDYRDRLICLKIDVEGHEAAVLSGARELLTGNRGVIQIENYSPHDRSLANLLERYGYNLLFHIGPDQYFSNMALTEHKIIAAFENACGHLIASNFAPAIRHDSPARINLFSGVSIEMSGRAARAARTAKRILMRRQ